MKCLVTGGAGFIGSHLVDRLLADGNQVRVIDNFSTGRQENLSRYQDNKNLTVIKADVSDFDSIKTHFQDVDRVFHIAALADIVPSIVNPLDYYRANVSGTASVLEAARLAKVKKLVYAASSSCYGIPDSFPTSESGEIRPEYPYALTKYLGEQIVLHWGKVYKLAVVSLRLFNVYGPRARTSGAYGAVFGVFLTQKLNHKPFTVVGNGKQTRDFVFVKDVVEAFVQASQSDCNGEVMNAGSGKTYSVNYLVKLLGGDTINIPKRPGEPDGTFADIGKISRALGWRPKWSAMSLFAFFAKNIDYWGAATIWTAENILEATKDWFKYLTK